MTREEFLQEFDKLDAVTKLRIYCDLGGKITPHSTPFLEKIKADFSNNLEGV